MKKNWIVLALLVGILGLPFLIRQDKAPQRDEVDETLVIVTPHNEAVRYEFTQGFENWYFKKTGKRVFLDWRILGGTQDAVRYVDSVYTNAFRLYWENSLGREWTPEVQEAFSRRANYQNYPKDSLVYELRDIFDKSDLSCGVDLFFGGGKVDIVLQSKKGQVVQLPIFENHADWFDEGKIPQEFRGNIFWDRDKRWVGTALSAFGIIFNREVLESLKIEHEPKQWSDLTDPAFLGQIAVSDPMASASFTMAFEIIIQQQMQQALNAAIDEGLPDTEHTKQKALAEGWLRGMIIIQGISANSRYFTDAATKPVLDVSVGNCAAGMAIDFYGLFQVENLKLRSGSKRFGFVMPKGGSAVSPDPVAMFRGSPHPDLANAFIEYTLSVEGQRLWDYKVSTPGGPKRYALNRAPIRKELYDMDHTQFRSNPGMNLYKDTEGFTYHYKWTSGLFKQIRFAIKVAFIDAHKELVDAWKAIIDARVAGRHEDANAAFSVMQNLTVIDYNSVLGSMKDVLYSGDPLQEIKFQVEITRHFRDQYKAAEEVAKGGRGLILKDYVEKP